MKCQSMCANKHGQDSDRQKFPVNSTGSILLNQTLDELSGKVDWSKCEVVYSYVIATIEKEQGYGIPTGFVQRGGAPNFQGDLITLCTCKHQMRAGKTVESWPQYWVAGFSSRASFGRHYLVYLMKVGGAFQHHKALHEHLKKENKNALEKKLATRHSRGDIYEPKEMPPEPQPDWFKPKSYVEPLSGHVHGQNNAWHNDIDPTPQYYGRHSCLLAGEKGNSFLWSKPMIYYNSNLTQGCIRLSQSNFLGSLCCEFKGCP